MKYFLLLLIASVAFTSCDKKTAPPKISTEDHSGQDHDEHEGHDHAAEKHDEHEGHDHAAEKHDEHEGHDDHEAASSTELSPQALKNMGVKVQAAKGSDYTISSPVTAVVTEDPLNEQPIYAPFAGRIQEIKLKTGQEVKANEILVTIIRAPIKRPELSLVQAILTPASEEYHSSISTLHSTVKSLELLNAELQRLEKFKNDDKGLSLVPQKDLIDLRYAIAKAQQELSNNRSKLNFHGLTDKEIQRIEVGEALTRTPNLWLNALRQNNIWNKLSDQLLKVLPANNQKNRWIIATIGELSAEELLTQELIEYFRTNKSANEHFLDMASMLQEGHTLTDIQNLHQLGAFEKIIQVRNSYSSADLEAVHITAGQSVASGEKLLTLTNPQHMLLEARPNGSEIALLNNAIKNSHKINARPLVSGSGITLSGLQVSKMTNHNAQQSSVLIPVQNSLLNQTTINNVDYRNWNLRPGLRYSLQVPIKQLKNVIVLPAEAIVDHGPDKVVFVRKRKNYLRHKVVIIYQNSEVVVLDQSSELRIGDAVVTSGAFALQLALIAGTPQAVDPHAGHNH